MGNSVPLSPTTRSWINRTLDDEAVVGTVVAESSGGEGAPAGDGEGAPAGVDVCLCVDRPLPAIDAPAATSPWTAVWPGDRLLCHGM